MLFFFTDPLYDDPMATNRSETTWKSFTSGFGEKIARLSGRGPKGSKQQMKNQNVCYRDNGIYSVPI